MNVDVLPYKIVNVDVLPYKIVDDDVRGPEELYEPWPHIDFSSGPVSALVQQHSVLE